MELKDLLGKQFGQDFNRKFYEGISNVPLLGGASRAFRYPKEFLRQLGGIGKYGISSLSGADQEKLQQIMQEYQQPMYMNEKEFGKMTGKAGTLSPVLEGMGAGADIASWATPMGPIDDIIKASVGAKTSSKLLPWALGKIGSGAVMGPVRGLASSDASKPETVLPNMLKSAGVSAGLNLGVGALQEGLGAIGNKMQRSASGIQAKKVPFGEQQSQKTFEETQSLTKGAKAQMTPRGLSKTWNKLGSELDESIKRSTVKSTSVEIADKSISKLISEKGMDESRARKLVESALNRAKAGDVLDAQGIANVKKLTESTAQKVIKAMDKGNIPSDTYYAEYLVNQTADEILKPGLDKLGQNAYQGMATLYQSAPDIITKATKGQTFYVPMLGVRVPTFGIPEKIGRLGGQALEKLGNSELVGKAAVFGGTDAAQPLGMNLENGQSQQEGEAIDLGEIWGSSGNMGNNVMTPGYGLGLTQKELMSLQQQSQPQQQQAYSVQDALQTAITMAPGASESTIMGLVKMLMEENSSGMGEATAGGKQAEADAQAALDQLDRMSQSIESQSDLFGPVRGSIAGATPLGGIETKSLNAEIMLAKQIIGKFLEGGVLRKEDEEKYKKILPLTTDQLPVAKAKIEALKMELQNRLERYRQSGYAGYGTGTASSSMADDYSAY